MNNNTLLPCPFCGGATMATNTILPTMLHAPDCYMVTGKSEAWIRRSTDPLVGELVVVIRAIDNRLKMNLTPEHKVARIGEVMTKYADVITKAREALEKAVKQ